MDLPGYDEATKLGYYLNYHGGDRKSAVYTKDGIHLDIRERGNRWGNKLIASLSFIQKFLIVSTPDFSFPNKNFSIFESQILLAKRRLEA